LAAALLCPLPAHAQAAPGVDPPTKIEVRAEPIASFDLRDPSRVRFGALDFRGGLVITSPHKEFGGISAIRVDADGSHFLALSDRGNWWRGRIVYQNGRPSGIADSEMAPVLGPHGGRLAARGWYDTESLTADGDTLYVGIERVHRIVRFNYQNGGLTARGLPIQVPPTFKTLTSNRGIECLAYIPEGLPQARTLLAIAEESLDADGNHRGFLIGGAQPGTFSVKRTDDFDVSDCALIPRGDLLVLERRYSPLRGVAMRIRRIPLASVKNGAVVDGSALIEADLGYQIDNMEGISVHRNAAGETVLTLISASSRSDV
jgi:hypothetical protein